MNYVPKSYLKTIELDAKRGIVEFLNQSHIINGLHEMDQLDSRLIARTCNGNFV